MVGACRLVVVPCLRVFRVVVAPCVIPTRLVFSLPSPFQYLRHHTVLLETWMFLLLSRLAVGLLPQLLTALCLMNLLVLPPANFLELFLLTIYSNHRQIRAGVEVVPFSRRSILP
jgi:hypothetical protein